MSAFVAADRFALLVSLVPYLRQRDDAVAVATVAEHFGVSAKEIRDAVQLIAVSGAPGESGVYGHLDLFDINWDAFELYDLIEVTHFVALEAAPRMSNREAAAVIAGLQYLRQLPNLLDAQRVDDLLEKLRPSGATTHFAISPRIVDESLRAVLARAIADGARVRFRYQRPGAEARIRTVDPQLLETSGPDAWLRGWCLDSDAERVFRLDRMRDAAVTGDRAEARPHARRSPDFFTASPEHESVLLELAPEAIPTIREYLPAGAPTPSADSTGRIQVEVRIASRATLHRLVAGRAGAIRILAPEGARQAMAEWAAGARAAQADTQETG